MTKGNSEARPEDGGINIEGPVGRGMTNLMAMWTMLENPCGGGVAGRATEELIADMEGHL